MNTDEFLAKGVMEMNLRRRQDMANRNLSRDEHVREYAITVPKM